MEKKTAVKKVLIIKSSGKTEEIPDPEIIKIETHASVEQYCGTFHISLKSMNRKNPELIEEKDEVEIWAGYEGKGISKIMAGYVDRIVLEKTENSDETMQVYGRSYESVLLDSRITGRIEYTNGLGQVLREVLKETPLKLDDIQDTEGSGIVMLRNIPLIDVVRQIAEELNWEFRVDLDKVFHFHPYVPPKSVVTLTSKDIKAYKIVKKSNANSS